MLSRFKKKLTWLGKELVRAILGSVATLLIGAVVVLLPPIFFWIKKGLGFFTASHPVPGWALSLGVSIVVLALFVIVRQIANFFKQRSRRARTDPLLPALKALKDNVPDWDGIPEKYVHEFHSILDNLESEGFDLSFFRVPEAEIRQNSRDCDRNFLMMKIGGVLNFFQPDIESKSRKVT